MPKKIASKPIKSAKKQIVKPFVKVEKAKSKALAEAIPVKGKAAPVVPRRILPIDEKIGIVVETVVEDGFDFVYEDVFSNMEIASSSSSEDLPEDLHDDDEKPSKAKRSEIKTVFDVNDVEDPLVGSPMEVRKELDALAIKLQRRPNDQEAFLKIVYYMHKYMLGLVFRKYSFVRGHDEKDIYQESLIALFKKAIPSFRKGKGMSFLNFAKMCINRHLITILNASRNRVKDKPLNTAIPLDHSPRGQDEDDESCLLSNIIPDKVHGKPPFTEMARSESFSRTLSTINNALSPFERAVLSEYLKDKSYRDASKSVSKEHGKRCNERSIDNALLRIRKKAMSLKDELGEDALPLVFGITET